MLLMMMEGEHRKPTQCIETVAFAEKHDSWLQYETAVEGRPKDTKVDRHRT